MSNKLNQTQKPTGTNVDRMDVEMITTLVKSLMAREETKKKKIDFEKEFEKEVKKYHFPKGGPSYK